MTKFQDILLFYKIHYNLFITILLSIIVGLAFFYKYNNKKAFTTDSTIMSFSSQNIDSGLDPEDDYNLTDAEIESQLMNKLNETTKLKFLQELSIKEIELNNQKMVGTDGRMQMVKQQLIFLDFQEENLIELRDYLNQKLNEFKSGEDPLLLKKFDDLQKSLIEIDIKLKEITSETTEWLEGIIILNNRKQHELFRLEMSKKKLFKGNELLDLYENERT